MKNWKRILTAVLAVAVLVSMCSMLAACGDSGNGDGGSADVTADQRLVVIADTDKLRKLKD